MKFRNVINTQDFDSADLFYSKMLKSLFELQLIMTNEVFLIKQF